MSADMKTGRVLADMPALELAGPLRRTLCQFDTAQATLQLAGAPENWQRAVMPYGAVLACYEDEVLPDGTQPQPILWAGYVTAAPRNANDTVTVALCTLEGYFDRRFVEDELYTAGTGWRAIAHDIVTTYVKTTVDDPGLDRITFAYTGDGAADPDGDTIWQNTDNASVLTRLGELVGRFGGEFTIEWAFSSDQKYLTPTLVMGDRIGAVATQAQPAVTFESPGPIADVTQDFDYSDGKGANKIVAFSSGEGSVTPYAPPVRAADFQGRPTVEYRFSPQTSQPSPTVLAQYSAQTLAILQNGSQAFTVSVATGDPAAVNGRRLGVDWRLGDDVGFKIGGRDQYGRETMLAWPGGTSGVARAIAYEVSDTTISPIFAQPVLPGGGGS